MRTLPDDTLVVFLSDTHIGGEDHRDIFETPDDLASLFDSIAAHDGPVELVLAGDFFDFLRISAVSDGENRASMTLTRSEYREVFAALERFVAGRSRRVVYLPGNHDAEIWWNDELRAELERRGLVHEFARSYAAAFASQPERVIYCEHGNQFDPANAIRDYDDPLDTPLGHHIVTELMPRIESRRAVAALNFGDIDRVFPLTTISEWIAARLFYAFVGLSIRYLLLPLAVAYAIYEALILVLDSGAGAFGSVLVDISYDVLVLLVAFVLVLFIGRALANRATLAAAAQFGDTLEHGVPIDTTGEVIRRGLERGDAPPSAAEPLRDIAVFVSGHTHAPFLTEFERHGRRGALANSGCWLRQLQPVPARLAAPPVFVSRYVQTHVRVRSGEDRIDVELWEHPRPAPVHLRVSERLAALGRLPPQPDVDAVPRVRQRLRL